MVGPLLLIAGGVVLPALLAGVLGQVARTALLLSLPLAVSVLLVNLLFFPGGQTVLFNIGPFTATAEGLAFAVEILVRIAAIAGAITLFYVTTRPPALVLDLERRGVSPLLAFVTIASVQTIPALVERTAQIIDAQRARGLDTEGSLLRRIRGVVPLVAPVILGSLTDVEERSLALEARGFTRPGRRTLLWSPADSSAQRLARWTMVAMVALLLTVRATGWLGPLP